MTHLNEVSISDAVGYPAERQTGWLVEFLQNGVVTRRLGFYKTLKDAKRTAPTGLRYRAWRDEWHLNIGSTRYQITRAELD